MFKESKMSGHFPYDPGTCDDAKVEDYYQGVFKKSSKLGYFPFDPGVGATNTKVEEVQVLFREPSSPQGTLVSQPLAPSVMV